MSASNEEHSQAVDESPISPICPDTGRKISQNDHSMPRPNHSELVEENIMATSAPAPGNSAPQKELMNETQLEKITLEDKPNDKILHRPSPEKLVNGGVSHDDSRTAEQAYEEAMEDEYAKREGGA
ncbi:hypothetical protein E4U09_006688 [Claviceps aff. purpurea]|uniref:Uncharacterized protein n=1 Tax=Claviceps aff. purpurea TaxID=1967640 RepID=A0A9P7TVZ7_9HYPO|nr:hypothetical protein E4U09_006688 [Claviceps aff. purpurea]